MITKIYTQNVKDVIQIISDRTKTVKRGQLLEVVSIEVSVTPMVIQPTQEVCSTLYPPPHPTVPTKEQCEALYPTPIPTKEECEKLYPPSPIPEPQPNPVPPPVPPPIPPQPIPIPTPSPDWWNGWPNPGWDGGDRMRFPDAVSGQPPARSFYQCLVEDAGCGNNWSWLAPYFTYYTITVVPSFEDVKKWYDYISKWVPVGLKDSGPHDSFGIAKIAQFRLRSGYIDGAACAYCIGEVSWSPEVPHGFNIVYCWEGELTNRFLIYFDLTMDIPPTKLVPGLIKSFFAYIPG